MLTAFPKLLTLTPMLIGLLIVPHLFAEFVKAQENNDPQPIPATQESDDLPWRSIDEPRPSTPRQPVPQDLHSKSSVPPEAPRQQQPNRLNQVPHQAQPIPTVLPTEPQLYPHDGSTHPNGIQFVSGSEPEVVSKTKQDTGSGNSITRVSKGISELPNSAGQIWREYDISPYTYNVKGSNRPQQAVLDWVLKETGYDLWFNEPLGILNATRDKLRVYHTPAVQAEVKKIVDRFVYNRGRHETIGLRLITISNPSWRQTAYTRLQPFDVKAQGIEGWMISKENAAILINELGRRADFQLHSGGDLSMHDGQTYNLSSKRPVSFVRSLRWVNHNGFPQIEPMATQLDEGFSLDLSWLGSLDGKTCEAIIKCDVSQIEKLQRVNVNIPTSTGQNQTVELQIPQMVSWNVNERFRWPSDQVLLLSCGVVATPGPKTNGIIDLQQVLNGSRRRADALLFVEYKGPTPKNSTSSTTTPATSWIPINGRR